MSPFSYVGCFARRSAHSVNRAWSRTEARRHAKFNRWTAEFGVAVHRYIEQYFHDTADVNDIAQDVWLIAWEHALQDSGLNLRWLLRVVDNLRRDAEKKEGSRVRAMGALELHHVPSAATRDELDHLALLDALDRLPSRYRHVVALRYWDDRSCGEIAELLGMTQTAVRKVLQRAHEKLRPMLDEERADVLLEH